MTYYHESHEFFTIVLRCKLLVAGGKASPFFRLNAMGVFTISQGVFELGVASAASGPWIEAAMAREAKSRPSLIAVLGLSTLLACNEAKEFLWLALTSPK